MVMLAGAGRSPVTFSEIKSELMSAFAAHTWPESIIFLRTLALRESSESRRFANTLVEAEMGLCYLGSKMVGWYAARLLWTCTHSGYGPLFASCLDNLFLLFCRFGFPDFCLFGLTLVMCPFELN